MAKSVTSKENRIRENVFTWYSKHKDNCDDLYDMANNPDITRIYEKVSDEKEKNALFSKADLIILTANKYERNILHNCSYLETKERIKEIDITLNTAIDFYNNVSAYYFRLCGYSIINVHSRVTGAYTNGGAADVIRYVLSNNYLYPVAVISFGICFGTNENKYDLGDVILSKKVYPYFIGAKVDGKELKVRDDNVFSICDKLAKKIENLKGKNQLNKESLGFEVDFGNYITGEAVVSSSSFRKQYIGITTQPIIAGDMEAYGVFRECRAFPFQIPCVVMKSICDWGIEKSFNPKNEMVISDYSKIVLACEAPPKNQEKYEEAVYTVGSIMDRLQAYAANNAFIVLKILLNNNVFCHSAFFSLKDNIKKNIEKDDYSEETWSHLRLQKTISNYLSHYHYSVSREYIQMIAFLLNSEGLTCNYKPESPDGFTFITKRKE